LYNTCDLCNSMFLLYPYIWLIKLFSGLPARYRDSVRAITPGLPLFLYNYTTHQLHGIFEVPHSFICCRRKLLFLIKTDAYNNHFCFVYKLQATSFGGSNIDPTAWEDKKCKGESRFPAQVMFLFYCNFTLIYAPI
jgi:Development and cell death domain